VADHRRDDSVLTTFEGEEQAVPPAGRKSRWLRVLAVIGVIVVVLLGGLAATGAIVAWRVDKNVERVEVFKDVPEENRPVRTVENAVNILLVGSDVRAGGQTTGDGGVASGASQRSDTIMLVHLPADRKSAYVVSLPRDAWVPIPGRGNGKINWAFSFGGAPLLVQTVEQLTDVHIDHFARVDFEGFKAMTDAVGGVDVPGAGHLDGEEALTFVRERYTVAGGDFGRIQNQQAFLRALMTKTQGQLDSPVALSKLLGAVTDAVSVDASLDAGALRSLALGARGLRSDSVRFATAPNKGTGMVGDQSVVHLDAAAGEELWTAMRDDRMSTWTPTP
jgi:anionic cell wall polymer biosynthesis LytR-Cps2A-Psr (LCP) family protein